MNETRAEYIRILRETATKWRIIGHWNKLEWLVKEADALEAGSAALEVMQKKEEEQLRGCDIPCLFTQGPIYECVSCDSVEAITKRVFKEEEQ
jgi:hypothetical protein